MTKVVVHDGNVDGAIRVLKQRNAKSGLQKEIRERQEGFLKPGVKRRKAKEEAIKKGTNVSNLVRMILTERLNK